MDLSAFIGELRRRHVVRLALAYVVVAWIVIEAASTILPALQVPDWGTSLVVVLVLLGFPVALVVAWGYDVTRQGVRKTGAAAPAVVSPAPPSAPPSAREAREAGGMREKSIAVLPFVNMSDDRENEYFSDGMTEEILNALVRVKELFVASRTSSFAFKDSRQDVREIAEKLSVATVLEGSVRKAGNRLRITAQLIDADEGYHLWSETYDREMEDVFAIQDDIARSIVEALKVELVGEEESGSLVQHSTENLEAYTLYLKGRHAYNLWTEDALGRSMEYFRRALEEDAEYARAYSGIADSLVHLADDWLPPEEAYPRAREAAEKAVELDPSLAEAHTALGKVLGWYEWSFDRAELVLRRAIAENPKYPEAHWVLGSVLPCNGRLKEALREEKEALALDPLSGTFRAFVARIHYFLRQYDEAIAESRKTLEHEPGATRAYVYMGQAYLAGGEPKQALEVFREGAEVGDVLSLNAYIAQALAALGEKDEAQRMLERLEAGGDGYIRAEFVAAGWSALGDADRAFAALDRALGARSGGLIYLHVDPSYDVLREDARYAAIVQAVGVR
ncbi:MAG: tetratricopeptide repeat protein [Gemmatimonadota bacterium]